mmetsp:Transcript_100840/g.323627  ORF Transcript_100840/g.323627 Transcript_100840/m.323627 type:complete len:227 (+) Transcript_100840:927-1607(+)
MHCATLLLCRGHWNWASHHAAFTSAKVIWPREAMAEAKFTGRFVGSAGNRLSATIFGLCGSGGNEVTTGFSVLAGAEEGAAALRPAASLRSGVSNPLAFLINTRDVRDPRSFALMVFLNGLSDRSMLGATRRFCEGSWRTKSRSSSQEPLRGANANMAAFKKGWRADQRNNSSSVVPGPKVLDTYSLMFLDFGMPEAGQLQYRPKPRIDVRIRKAISVSRSRESLS